MSPNELLWDNGIVSTHTTRQHVGTARGRRCKTQTVQLPGRRGVHDTPTQPAQGQEDATTPSAHLRVRRKNCSARQQQGNVTGGTYNQTMNIQRETVEGIRLYNECYKSVSDVGRVGFHEHDAQTPRTAPSNARRVISNGGRAHGPSRSKSCPCRY